MSLRYPIRQATHHTSQVSIQAKPVKIVTGKPF